MIHCPYCLYKNVAGVTICGNCKSTLPLETPSRKLLSYTSQSTNSGDEAPIPHMGPTLVAATGPVLRQSVSQTHRISASPTRLRPERHELQAGQAFTPEPEALFQPTNIQMNQGFTPMPDLPFSSFEGQATRVLVQDLPLSPSEPQQPASQASSVVPMGTPTSQVVISTRRAFAGYGIPLQHRSFLLPRAGMEAGKVLQEIGEILHARNSSLQISEENLHENGFQAEERHYLIVRHRVSTVFIYVAPAGDDLYISRSTSVLCPISTGRVIMLALMILAIFFSLLILADILAVMRQSGEVSLLAAPGTDAILGLLMALLALISFAVLSRYLMRSFAYWLREKDFKVYLRSLFIRDFELDDIMLLEHVTDETIRVAVDRLGLDGSQITPPPDGYKQERRIRLA